MRTIKSLILIALLACVSMPAWAQSIISGTVYEKFGASKEPCMGVNVYIQNEQNRTLDGIITDMNGRYSLKVPAGKNLSLVFSFIGMATQRIPYTGQKTLDVVMSEDSQQLKEVVVATERTQKSEMGVSAKAFTGASQSIKMDQVMETVPVASVEEALQGQLAGVDITAGGDPGAKGSIRIRGTATLNTSADPLIVINGVPYNTDIADDFDFATANTEDFADMLSLNPNDIESIEVLKDAASTAIYGTKGANGVLLITTKKGTKGKPKFTFSNKTTVNVEPASMKMLDGNEYTAFMQDAIWNTANARGLDKSADLLEMLFSDKSYAIGYQPDWSYFDEYNCNTDWLSDIRQNVVTTDNNFSMSGGGEKANYRFSLGYTTQDGTTRGTGMTRLTSTLNIGYNFSDRLNVVSEFTYSDTENDASYLKSEVVRTEALLKMPNKSPYYIDNVTKEPTDIYFTYQDANEFQGAYTGSRNFHPIAMVNESFNNTNTKEEKITFRPTYKILVDENKVPILSFTGYVSMKFKTVKTNKFLPQEATGVSVDDTNSNLSYDGYSNNFSLQTESKFLFNKGWRDDMHRLVAAAIWRTAQSQSSTYASQVYGVATGGMADPTTGGTIYKGSINSGNSESRSLSGIINMNYTFNKFLSLNMTTNIEGNASLGDDNRWGVFQSYGGALNLQELNYFKENAEWLSQGKFRASWGQSGKAPSGTSHIGTYNAEGQYITGSAVVPSSMQLNKLKWQTSTEYDFGFDLGLWDNRLRMTFDYYNKTTDDLLQKNVMVSSVTSYATIAYINDGSMRNKGWEYRIDYDIFKNKDWRVAVNFNINRNENEIVDLPGNLTQESYSMKNGAYAQKYVEGTPVGSFFGYRYKGVYQNTNDTYARDEEGNIIRNLQGEALVMKNGSYTCYPGDAMYEDINHDGIIDKNDIVYLGNANPMVTGGGGANVSYKNWALTIFLHYRLGQKVINQARMDSEAMYSTDNQSKAVLRRWRNEGDDTEIPRALYKYGYNYLGSDRFVEDCSYVRLKTLSLSYKLPKKYCEKIYASGLSFFITGYDLFTFTNYKGQDPEVSLPSGIGSLAKDNASTPRSRRFAAGVTLNF